MIRVLVVEDDKLARMGLLTMLPWAEHGMQVVGEAANGAKALDFLDANEADLCFVDLMMPVMSGLEFIKAASARYPSLQFVVLTFHEDFGYLQTALRLGVLDYISKLELEHADFDQMMRRLTQKLNNENVEHTELLGKAAWEAELLNKHWLYDAAALEALVLRMALEPVPMTVLERLLVRVVLENEADTKLAGPSVPRLISHDQAAGFMRRYRNEMLALAASSQDLARLPICLLKAIAMVHEDIAQNLHTDAVAARVGLSRPYFSSSFSREAGIPFNAYVRRERVNTACRLLETTRLSVSQIAVQVGYEDVRSFVKLFQEQTGDTPASYRRSRK